MQTQRAAVHTGYTECVGWPCQQLPAGGASGERDWGSVGTDRGFSLGQGALHSRVKSHCFSSALAFGDIPMVQVQVRYRAALEGPQASQFPIPLQKVNCALKASLNSVMCHAQTPCLIKQSTRDTVCVCECMGWHSCAHADTRS